MLPCCSAGRNFPPASTVKIPEDELSYHHARRLLAPPAVWNTAMRRRLLLSGVFLAAASSRAATYYADNSPTGNGSCDNASNRGRIATCVARMSAPGDTVSLASGTVASPKVYTGSENKISLTVHGTAASPVTVSAETTFGVVLDGQGVNEMFVTRAQYSRLIGVTIKNAPPGPNGKSREPSRSDRICDRHECVPQRDVGLGWKVSADSRCVRRSAAARVARHRHRRCSLPDLVRHESNLSRADFELHGRDRDEDV